MTIEKVEGIVISETNYSESSKILNIFTKEYGKIGVLSKGCRKMKSPLRAVSAKLIYGSFHIYYKENGLSTLIAVDLIDSFKKIMTDLTCITYASYLLELVDQVLRQMEEEQIYSVFIATLKKMNEGFSPAILTCIFELKTLAYLGVQPMIDHCSLCGSDKAILTIDAGSGGFVCASCHTNQKIISDKAIKLIRMFFYVEIDKISKLEVKDTVLKEINDFIDDYYDRYTGLYLKSKKFLQNLTKVS